MSGITPHSEWGTLTWRMSSKSIKAPMSADFWACMCTLCGTVAIRRSVIIVRAARNFIILISGWEHEYILRDPSIKLLSYLQTFSISGRERSLAYIYSVKENSPWTLLRIPRISRGCKLEKWHAGVLEEKASESGKGKVLLWTQRFTKAF